MTGSTSTQNLLISNKFVKDSVEFANKDRLYRCEQRINEIHHNLKEYIKVDRLEADWFKIREEFNNEIGHCVKESDLQK